MTSTELEKQKMWDRLKESPMPINPNVEWKLALVYGYAIIKPTLNTVISSNGN